MRESLRSWEARLPEPNAAPSESGDDLRAELEGAWSETESTESAPTGADASAPASTGAAQPSAPPSDGAPVDAGRARNPDGTFARGGKSAPVAQGRPAEFKVPEKWPAEIRAKLQEIHSKAPDHAQFLLDQYGFMRQQHAQAQNRANSYLQSYEQFLAPGRHERALRGIDDGAHIRHLLAADDFINKSPAQAIQWLAHTHGIDLQKLANPQAAGEPEMPQWAREMQEQQRQFAQMVRQQSIGMEERDLAVASSWIDDFANAVDQQGNKLYPHFDDVINDIIYAVQHQMQTGQPVNVKAAYDRAVRLNDQVWLKDQRARSESAKAAEAAQRKRDIEEAKRAAVSVSGSSASSRLDAPDSIHAALEQAWDEHS